MFQDAWPVAKSFSEFVEKYVRDIRSVLG